MQKLYVNCAGLLLFNVCICLCSSDCPMTMADYEQRSHAYMTSSSSWYGHDIRRPVSWSNMDEIPYNGRSSYPVHPVPVDYSAGAAPDVAAAGGWSLVDLKPTCITPCGLSAYTGRHQPNLTRCHCLLPKFHYYDLVCDVIYDQVLSRKKSQTSSPTFFCSKPAHRPRRSSGIWPYCRPIYRLLVRPPER